MPDPANGCSGLSSIFVDHVYSKESTTDKKWKLIAAISGAHTLGGAQIQNSGFDGFWSDSANSGKFNNNYYKSIIAKGWVPQRNVGGNANKV
jgi:catalase (peroxidase I)